MPAGNYQPACIYFADDDSSAIIEIARRAGQIIPLAG
jgi:hypothetical protein